MNLAALLAGAGLSLAGGGADVTVRRARALSRRGRLGVRSQPRSGDPRPRGVRWAVIGVTVAAVGTTVVRGLALGVATVVVGLTAVMLCSDALRERADVRRRASLLVALRMVVTDLDAGAQADVAIEAAARSCPEYERSLCRMAVAVRAGKPIVADHVDLVPLAHACAVATSTGAPLAAVLGRVTDDVEQAVARRLRLAALTAGPRASTVILALLPALGLLLGSSLGARPVQVLLSTSLGHSLTCAGVVFDALGVLWVRHILRGARR
jgi:tight adherence protein B